MAWLKVVLIGWVFRQSHPKVILLRRACWVNSIYLSNLNHIVLCHCPSSSRREHNEESQQILLELLGNSRRRLAFRLLDSDE